MVNLDNWSAEFAYIIGVHDDDMVNWSILPLTHTVGAYDYLRLRNYRVYWHCHSEVHGYVIM